MALAEHIANLLEYRRTLLEEEFEIRQGLNRALEVVVLGTGDWVARYRENFGDYAATFGNLIVTYVDTAPSMPDDQYRKPWAKRLHDHDDDVNEVDQTPGLIEVVMADWCVSCMDDIATLNPDVVLVATPDKTHTVQAARWIGSDVAPAPTPLVIIEKPLATEVAQIDELESALAMSPTPVAVRGMDHYLARAHGILGITDTLSGHIQEVAEIHFHMWEDDPIEPERLPSLQTGITYDMASHFFGILTLVAGDDLPGGIVVKAAGQHVPLVSDSTFGVPEDFDAETYSDIGFDMVVPFQGRTIWCESHVGKGQPREVKCLDIVDPEGSLVRLDYTRGVSYRVEAVDTTFDDGCLVMCREAHTDGGTPCPHHLRHLQELPDVDVFERLAPFEYADVLRAAAGGENEVLGTLIPTSDSKWVVGSLESMRTALADARANWTNHPVGELP